MARIIVLVCLLAVSSWESARACSCIMREPLCKALAKPGAKLESSAKSAVFVGRVRYSFPTWQEEFGEHLKEFDRRHPELRPKERTELLGWLKQFMLQLWGDKASAEFKEKLLRIQNDSRLEAGARLLSYQAMARLDVVEPFAGTEKGSVIEMLGGLGNGDCSVHFQAGESYLVSAYQDEYGFWTTSTCSGSRPVLDAQADLKAYRTLRDKQSHKPFVAGSLTDATDRGERSGSGGIGKFPLRLVGEGFQKDFVTNADGTFVIDDVAPGKYRIDLLKSGWQIPPPMDERANFTLDDGCAEVGLFAKEQQSSVVGRAVPAKGSTLVRVPVALVPLNRGPVHGYRSGPMDANGTYRIQNVEPGDYLLAINPNGLPLATSMDDNPRAMPYPKNYYPGAESADDAEIIHVERGKAVEAPEVWKLPPPIAEKKIECVVVKANGEPFVDARVIVRDGLTKIAVNRAGPVPKDGMVSFNVLEGRTYRVEVAAFDAERKPTHYALADLKPDHQGRLTVKLVEGSVPENDRILFVGPWWK